MDSQYMYLVLTVAMSVSVVMGKPFMMRGGVQCPESCVCTQEVIDCEGRGLKSWPVMAASRAVTGINMYGNSLTDIPADGLARFPNLEWVFLGSNRLTTVPEKLFSGNQKLLGVWLDENLLTSLPRNLFFNQKHVNILSLANNRLRKLPPGTFTGLDSLEMLDLSGNDLTDIKPQTVTPLGSLLSLNLADNPLDCQLLYDLPLTIPDIQVSEPCLNMAM